MTAFFGLAKAFVARLRRFRCSAAAFRAGTRSGPIWQFAPKGASKSGRFSGNHHIGRLLKGDPPVVLSSLCDLEREICSTHILSNWVRALVSICWFVCMWSHHYCWVPFEDSETLSLDSTSEFVIHIMTNGPPSMPLYVMRVKATDMCAFFTLTSKHWHRYFCCMLFYETNRTVSSLSLLRFTFFLCH